MSLEFRIDVGLMCFHDKWIVLKVIRMDESPKEKVRPELWGFQCLCDREARKN